MKRENIYAKPFYKQKLKVTFLTIFVMAIIFFAYQLFYIRQLQIEIERKSSIVYNSEKVIEERRAIRYVKYDMRPKLVWVYVIRVRLFAAIRGIRLKDFDVYNPVVRDAFICIRTGKSIPFERLNDNYCDCIEDGSDEPETNACTNGIFYCSYQTR